MLESTGSTLVKKKDWHLLRIIILILHNYALKPGNKWSSTFSTIRIGNIKHIWPTKVEKIDEDFIFKYCQKMTKSGTQCTQSRVGCLIFWCWPFFQRIKPFWMIWSKFFFLENSRIHVFTYSRIYVFTHSQIHVIIHPCDPIKYQNTYCLLQLKHSISPIEKVTFWTPKEKRSKSRIHEFFSEKALVSFFPL